MTSLADIPDDVLYNEIFPQMGLSELIDFGYTSQKHTALVDNYFATNPNISSGVAFQGLSDKDIFELGKRHYILRKQILTELFRRMNLEYSPRRPNLEDYIYELLPDKFTIVLNDTDVITANRESIRGIFDAITDLKLQYSIKYRATADGQNDIPIIYNGNNLLFPGPGLLLYRRSGDNYYIRGPVANQPNYYHIRNFTSMDYLSSYKKVYESNNIPFPITHFYRQSNHRKIPIRN